MLTYAGGRDLTAAVGVLVGITDAEFVQVYVCMYVCMHVCMYVCMYVCTYIHAYMGDVTASVGVSVGSTDAEFVQAEHLLTPVHSLSSALSLSLSFSLYTHTHSPPPLSLSLYGCRVRAGGTPSLCCLLLCCIYNIYYMYYYLYILYMSSCRRNTLLLHLLSYILCVCVYVLYNIFILHNIYTLLLPPALYVHIIYRRNTFSQPSLPPLLLFRETPL
jgi:hypothetical protein